MLWLILLSTALLLFTLGNYLWAANEVYALVLYLTVAFLGCWGIGIAPTVAQIALGLWVLSRLRTTNRQTS